MASKFGLLMTTTTTIDSQPSLLKTTEEANAEKIDNLTAAFTQLESELVHNGC